MKVTIRDRASGKTKTMDQRYADVLVRMKRAEYVDAPDVAPQRQTYQTKVMTAAPVQATIAQPVQEVKENASAEEILAAFGIQAPPATDKPVQESDSEEPKRQRGRPKKVEE